MGSREMARLLGLEHTRVNRLMGTLAALGLAERGADRKYAPGPGLHVLAAMSLQGSRLLSAALPHVARLREAHPELTVALGVLWRTRVAYLLFAAPGERLEAAVASRGLFPAEKSSIGQALLAGRTDAEVRELYRDRPAAEVSALLQALAAVRESGHALVDGTTLGLTLGQPPVAGLAMAGGLAGADRTGLIDDLRETAAAIAQALSCREGA
jgi:DNA-binding IclR family transcriptional regulator